MIFNRNWRMFPLPALCAWQRRTLRVFHFTDFSTIDLAFNAFLCVDVRVCGFAAEPEVFMLAHIKKKVRFLAHFPVSLNLQ